MIYDFMYLIAQMFPYEVGQAAVGWLALKLMKLMKMTIWTLLELFCLIYYGTDKRPLKKVNELMHKISILLEGDTTALVFFSASQSHLWSLPVSVAHLR